MQSTMKTIGLAALTICSSVTGVLNAESAAAFLWLQRARAARGHATGH